MDGFHRNLQIINFFTKTSFAFKDTTDQHQHREKPVSDSSAEYRGAQKDLTTRRGGKIIPRVHINKLN